MLQTKEDPIENGSVCPASERERLISEHIPLIKFHASRLATQLFSPKGADQLIDAGVIGLIEAVTTYEPGGQLPLNAYADRCIRATMIERLRALNGTRCRIYPRARKPSKTSQKLRPKLRYEARDLELAMAIGIDVEQLASFELIAQISGLSVGAFSKVAVKCDPVESEEKLISYYPEHDSDRPSCVVKKGRLLQILTKAVNELPGSERLVISLHYVEELTVKEIATILRMGEWRVLQLHTKAVLRLRTRLRFHMGPHEEKQGDNKMNEIQDPGSLQNVHKLGVVIESLPSELERRELYQQRLRTQVEDRLSQAGIEVLPERDAINNGLPYLYVNVNLIKTDVGLYVFATRVCLKQTMLLPREPFVELYTSTWETGGVGTVGVNNLSAMLGSIRQQLDRFCQDHLAENLDSASDGYQPYRKLETSLVSRYRLPGWIKQLANNFSSIS